MSHAQSPLQAIEWLEQQLTDLAGIRNATPRDPSFKNWRQGTLTVMQRIWPGDQDRQERFRRIPFSPADPRADARTIREWYSRGCQEATRVLAGFVAEIRAQGVPDIPDDVAQNPSSGEFGVDFPTVDLPSGDLGSAVGGSQKPDDLLQDLVEPAAPSAGHLPPLPPGPTLSVPATPPTATAKPTPAHVAPQAPAPPPAPVAARARAASAPDPRQPKKGMKAKLRDLLELAQLSAKAIASQLSEPAPAAPAPRAAQPPPRPAPKLDMIPVGDEFMSTPPGSSTDSAIPAPPALQRPAAAAPRPAAAPVASQPVAPPTLPPSQPVAAEAPPAPQPESRIEPGMSVVMSRPTTLRAIIEKVSIDSLISPEFRSPGAEESATPPAAGPKAPAPPSATPPAREMPPVAHMPPPTPSASMPAPPVARVAPPTPSASMPAPPVAPTSSASISAPPVARTPSTSIPVPSGPPSQPFVSPLPAAPAAESNVVPLPVRPSPDVPPVVVEIDVDTDEEQVDPEAFARAAEDLMRASPVLGATGRRVTRGYDEPTPEAAGFADPDAIAIASAMSDLDALGVPAARQPEARARLLDLSRRLESGDVEWAALRKAVWFAMEYPELARRIMPLLLPWIDRAA